MQSWCIQLTTSSDADDTLPKLISRAASRIAKHHLPKSTRPWLVVAGAVVVVVVVVVKGVVNGRPTDINSHPKLTAAARRSKAGWGWLAASSSWPILTTDSCHDSVLYHGIIILVTAIISSIAHRHPSMDLIDMFCSRCHHSQPAPARSIASFLFLVLFCLLSALLAVGAWLPLSTFAVVRSASRVAFSGVTVPPERRWLSCLARYKMIASPLDPTAMGIRAEYEIPRRIAVFLSRHLMVKFGAIC
ncbi:hypothetical protein FALCPG4_000982 [Fusarium falciforme]